MYVFILINYWNFHTRSDLYVFIKTYCCCLKLRIIVLLLLLYRIIVLLHAYLHHYSTYDRQKFCQKILQHSLKDNSCLRFLAAFKLNLCSSNLLLELLNPFLFSHFPLLKVVISPPTSEQPEKESFSNTLRISWHIPFVLQLRKVDMNLTNWKVLCLEVRKVFQTLVSVTIPNTMVIDKCPLFSVFSKCRCGHFLGCGNCWPSPDRANRLLHSFLLKETQASKFNFNHTVSWH